VEGSRKEKKIGEKKEIEIKLKGIEFELAAK
jgi:hypothetical protein